MSVPSLADAAHTAAALAAVLLLAWAGRAAFRAIRQPPVIGEIAVGLVLGPVVVALAGHGVLDTLLPAHVLAALRHVGHAGLMLFLLGIAHELRARGSATGNRAVVWVASTSFLPALAAGAAAALWIDRSGGAALRGDAPLSSFVLLLAVAFAVTAVPVLARILADRGMTATTAGRLSLQAAVVMDVPAWLLLAVAVGGSGGDLAVPSAVLAGCVAAVLLVRPLLAGGPAGAFCARSPAATAVLLAAATLMVASATEHLGLTSLFGAFAVGFMVPADSDRAPWSAAVGRVARIGDRLMPVFFLVTGVTIVSGPLGGMPWSVMGAVTLLAIAVKTATGYLGGRLGGESHATGLRLAALMNTRGLTEIVVLQAGFSAGILSPPLFAALLGMTLITTCLTAPLLSLIDRAAGPEEGAAARPAAAQTRGARSDTGRE
ncbi:cation:proton antiporter [Nocardiopsis mangrovi]|uniref:Cation:proton antiporter n=1 Tax=Nocardiopsis mangrovi TaxID=1179818 RepID=A0ABV9E4M7_9ACTN